MIRWISQDIFSRDKDMWDLLDRALNIPMLQILLILLYLVILSKILCHLIYEAVH